MSDSTLKTLNDEGYKNWIKGVLGLLNVETFLSNLLEHLLKTQYEDILRGYTGTTEKYKRIKNSVKSYHLFGMEKWSNSRLQNNDISDEERFNHVEFSKCFIRPSGYLEKISIFDIDYSGLIHILIDNTGLHGRLKQPPQRAGQKKDQRLMEPNVFSQALDVRNRILHSATKRLSTDSLRQYLSQLIDLLDNIIPKEVSGTEEEIQQAKSDLTNLQEIDFQVSFAAENYVLQEVIASFETDMKCVKITERQILEDIGELRGNIKDHESRISALERIRKESEELKEAHRAHIDQKQRRELQNRLIELYEESYVKTATCPFFQRDNDIEIEEIYAKPNIEELKNSVTRKIEPSHLLRKNNKGNRKVFVIGNVGTGKTSLCRYFLRLWCHSVKERRAIESNTKSDEFENIIQELKKFDFVFFLPLCAVSEGLHNFEDMIKMYYKEFDMDKIIDDLFEIDSEKCLIIADGLNEWKLPQNNDPLPLHHTYGIPVLSILRKSTVLVTSRPTAIGILYMRKSDRFLQVKLLGVVSMDDMIEKYYDKHDHSFISKDDISKKIKKWTENHKLDTPMLISCFVLMLMNPFNRYDIEQSCVSATYCSVINIMLEWQGKKSGITSNFNCEGNNSSSENNNSSCDDKTEQMQLPEMLEKYEISSERRHIILQLGRIAFDMHNKKYASICQRDVEKYCSGDQLKCVIDSGILLKEMSFFPNEVPQLSFIHSSFWEYFVALHLVINSQHQTTEILEQLFETCKKATDIMALSNVIVFICGLSPKHLESIFKHIYQRLSDQSTMVFEHKDIFQIQELLRKCLLEHRFSSNTEPPNIIPHYALLVSGEPVEFTDAGILIQNVDVGKVMNITVDTCRISNIVEEITDACYFLKVFLIQKLAITPHCFEINGLRADNLKSLSISKCIMTHDDYQLFQSLIGQAVSLELLTLEDVICETSQNGSHDRHNLDLRKNSKIKVLSLKDRKNAIFYKLTNKNLEKCILLHRGLSDIDCLLTAQNLQHLQIGSGDERFDSYNRQMNNVLQTLGKLQTLYLRNMECSEICPIASGSMKDLHNIKLSNVKVTPKSFTECINGLRCRQHLIRVEALCLFEKYEELYNFVNIVKQTSGIGIIDNCIKPKDLNGKQMVSYDIYVF